MTILTDYAQFDGRHWETGTIRNVLAYQGITTPHTHQPFSEALLLGISGGIVMGYFSFAYEGYDPQVNILTRNTFDPLDRLLERLGIIQERLRTSQEAKGITLLRDTLADGRPAIVWADVYSLPYNAMPADDGMWAMFPIIVYSHTTEQVLIADRARVPLHITPAELATARGRVKQDKFQIMTIDYINHDKLVSAVRKGIWDCISLFIEKPPKGTRNNFGLAAYQAWSKLLTDDKNRTSWIRQYSTGPALYAVLASAYSFINSFGKEGHAERDIYATFLDEASLLLNNNRLSEVAHLFRRSAQAWDDLSAALLPNDAPLLGETRNLLDEKHRLFMDSGQAELLRIRDINTRLVAIREAVATDFPLNASDQRQLRHQLSEHILRIHDIERDAIAMMQACMS